MRGASPDFRPASHGDDNCVNHSALHVGKDAVHHPLLFRDFVFGGKGAVSGCFGGLWCHGLHIVSLGFRGRGLVLI